MEKLFREHMTEDSKNFDLLKKVIFGDPDDEEDIGMKGKVDKIHDILVQVDNVKGFFGGIGTFMKWVLVLGALIALFKGWLLGIITTVIPR